MLKSPKEPSRKRNFTKDAFSVVAKNDHIVIEHLGTEYKIDVLDCKPRNVVVIVETDVEVDIEYGEK